MRGIRLHGDVGPGRELARTESQRKRTLKKAGDGSFESLEAGRPVRRGPHRARRRRRRRRILAAYGSLQIAAGGRRRRGASHDRAVRQRRARLPRPGVVELRRRLRPRQRAHDRARSRRTDALRGRRRRRCLEDDRHGRLAAADRRRADAVDRRAARSTPSHGLWVGTGEANTSSDSYAGIGVLHSADGGANFSRVGGDELKNHTDRPPRLRRTAASLAATSRGLYGIRPTTTPARGRRCSGGVGCSTACAQSGDDGYVSDVAVRPGTGGQIVDAVVGWRAGSDCNGFFDSTDGGQTFSRGTVTARSTTTTSAARRSRTRPTARRLTRSCSRPRCSTTRATDQRRHHAAGRVRLRTATSAGTWNKIAEWRQPRERRVRAAGSARATTRACRPGTTSSSPSTRPNAEPRLPRARGGLRDEGRRRSLERDRPVLELRPAVLRRTASTPARRRRTPTSTPSRSPATRSTSATTAASTAARPERTSTGVDDLNDDLRHAAVLLRRRRPGAPAATRSGAACRTTASRCSRPARRRWSRRSAATAATRSSTRTNGEQGRRRVRRPRHGADDERRRSDGTDSARSARSRRRAPPSPTRRTRATRPALHRAVRGRPDEPDHWVAGGQFVWDNQGKGWDTTCGVDRLRLEDRRRHRRRPLDHALACQRRRGTPPGAGRATRPASPAAS